jgi:hypothetical protein
VNSATTGAPRYGLLVTGQSLFRSEAGKLTGTIADYELADYTADYDFVLTQLERVSAAGLPVVCLTGDVHWGRTLRADDGGAVWAPIFEVISSPLSLVSTVFADQAKEVWNTITGLWGATNPWPRHSDPEDPPPRFGTQGRFATGVLQRIGGGNAAMRGNHAVMLRFARAGTGLDVRVEYYPLHADPQVNSAGQFTAYFELKLQPVARA